MYDVAQLQPTKDLKPRKLCCRIIRIQGPRSEDFSLVVGRYPHIVPCMYLMPQAPTFQHVRLTMLRLLRACDDSHLPVVQAGNLGVLLGVSAELRRVTLLVR
jgi:hypothetical protein